MGLKDVSRLHPIHLAPPADLGASGRDLWSKLVQGYRIEDESGQAILNAAPCAATPTAFPLIYATQEKS